MFEESSIVNRLIPNFYGLLSSSSLMLRFKRTDVSAVPALQKKKNPLRKRRHQARAVTKAMEKRAITRTSDRSKSVIF